MKDARLRIAIAVRVVDNFGDAGVAWRLARQLHAEHGAEVVLWIDAPDVLARFVPALAAHDVVKGVHVRTLDDAAGLEPWPHAVIAAFGSTLPARWTDAIESAARPPVWIHLEYLSAEAWVEGAHGLPSPHPTRRLTRWYYYPGFTARTGGLLRERDLLARRDAFVRSPGARSQPWIDAGLRPPRDVPVLVSLFCYPTPVVTALLDTWADSPSPVAALVPEGVAAAAITAFAGRTLASGTVHVDRSLSLAVVPFVDQDAFDHRLWACDFAVVRGEDSFLRAQWAARPLAWHIYPQDEDAHRIKLEAFLARYTAHSAPAAVTALADFTRAFNAGDAPGVRATWPAVAASLPALREHAAAWSAHLAALPDLATQLVDFVQVRL